jgi:hypothetical protein
VEAALPEHVVINNDYDNMRVGSIVGSGKSMLETDNKIHVRGAWADMSAAQDTRKLINGKHLRNLSCAYRDKRWEGSYARADKRVLRGAVQH